MKLQLVLFKMLNLEAQILQRQGRNWGLGSRRRFGREELSEERTSLYVETQRGHCMLRAADPRGWVHGCGFSKARCLGL